MSSNGEFPDLSPLRLLAPAGPSADFARAVAQARSATVAPFQADRLAVLKSLSQRILRHPRLRREPGGASLGFWLRRSHLATLEADFKRGSSPAGLRVAAGLALHIAPANVDTMFVLSWALSFLAGNANVVRLTTRSNEIVEALLECLNECFAAAPAVTAANWFTTYEHNDAITAHLSALCDTRIIWGGDETVNKIRALPLSPHAADRAFASKRSLSIFDTTHYLGLSETKRAELAGRMAADIMPFGQMGCSSPHVLYWIGAEDAPNAPGDFALRLEAAMAAKTDAPELAGTTRRIIHAFDAVAAGRASALQHAPHTTALTAMDVTRAEPDDPCGAGMLVHAQCRSLAEVCATLDRHHQTITCEGLSAADKATLAAMAGRAGVDRIVPVGRALDFGVKWDGFDLWQDLTRFVVVE